MGSGRRVDYDYVVVGGGIVGLSTAFSLLQSRPGAGVLVVEKEAELAAHQTGRNSGVIHSGIYYQPGSLKAELCRWGAQATKQFAREHHIPMQECGKLLVATNDRELVRLGELEARASLNGIDAERIDAAELRRREPYVSGLGALFIKETGITDYSAITRALADRVLQMGGDLKTMTPVTGIQESSDHVALDTPDRRLTAHQVVFCGGLQSDRLARMAGVNVDFQIIPFRGEYFDVRPEKSQLVSTLIYPVPDPDLPFLGVHLTPSVHGGLSVGPNAVLGLAREGYRRFALNARDLGEMMRFPGLWRVARNNLRTGVREMRNSIWKAGYLQECQKYAPSLEADDLVPSPAGIRAQAVMQDGTFVHDFLLRETPRTLHVVNAPSPAATSALPIGQRITEHLFRNISV